MGHFEKTARGEPGRTTSRSTLRPAQGERQNFKMTHFPKKWEEQHAADQTLCLRISPLQASGAVLVVIRAFSLFLHEQA